MRSPTACRTCASTTKSIRYFETPRVRSIDRAPVIVVTRRTRQQTSGMRGSASTRTATAGRLAVVPAAERLGYDSIWVAEAYGLDALTPMAWWAAQTTSIGLGTIVTVVDGRTPATTAMSAMTIDHLSAGRFTLGLGVSGPAVVEGWYGRPFRKPLARTREYVEVDPAHPRACGTGRLRRRVLPAPVFAVPAPWGSAAR